MDRIKRRRETLVADLEQVGRSLRTDYRTKLSIERIQRVCTRLGGVLDGIGAAEWKALLREFGFKVILQKELPHVMRVSVDLEPSPSAVLQHS